jgi:hypothetical protein
MLRNKVRLAAGVALFAGVCVPLAVAQIAAPEAVETAQLPTDAFAIGAIEASEGALPTSLWEKSDPQTLDFLLSHAPLRPASPSLGEALRRTLLSPGVKPAGADASLGGKKLLALARAGFVSEARDIASLATSGRSDMAFAEADATIALLNGDSDGACRRGASLNGGREAIFWVKLRAFCYARAGEIDAFDLTMNLLRERGALSATDEALLLATAAGEPPKTVPVVETPLQYAASKATGIALNPAHLSRAEGGVVAAVEADSSADTALRIEAAELLLAMGVADTGALASLFNGLEFNVAQIAAASDAVAAKPNDPLTDALVYQSIAAMSAPDFIRDKAQRISSALGRADSFHRAYALSLLYADEIVALEGVLVTPSEAANFALARMAAGDSVGAGRWLSAMIGVNETVAALPEDLGGAFIDRVNLLALLDPQTATRIARAAGVSLLSDEPALSSAVPALDDPAVTARVLQAAFDAVAGDKIGQAGLAALAASAGRGGVRGEVEAVVVSEGLDAAGMPELRRRHAFERAWASTFPPPGAALVGETPGGATPAATAQEEGGLIPRLKPPRNG